MTKLTSFLFFPQGKGLSAGADEQKAAQEGGANVTQMKQEKNHSRIGIDVLPMEMVSEGINELGKSEQL